MTYYEACKVFFIMWIAVMVSVSYIMWRVDVANEGVAKAEYLSAYHGLDLAPERARFIGADLQLFELSLSDITILK
jgi:hypothetical protein